MGNAGGSSAQKKFKQQEHQRERTAVRCLINSEEHEMPSQKKFGNEWDSPRDGKMWFGNCKERWPEEYIKWKFQ